MFLFEMWTFYWHFGWFSFRALWYIQEKECLHKGFWGDTSCKMLKCPTTQEASHWQNTQVKKGRRYHKLAALFPFLKPKVDSKDVGTLGECKKRDIILGTESHGYLAGSVGRRSQRPKRNRGTLKTVLSVAASCYSPITWELCHRHYWKPWFFCIQTVARHWQIGRFGGWDAGARHEPSSGATTER